MGTGVFLVMSVWEHLSVSCGFMGMNVCRVEGCRCECVCVSMHCSHKFNCARNVATLFSLSDIQSNLPVGSIPAVGSRSELAPSGAPHAAPSRDFAQGTNWGSLASENVRGDVLVSWPLGLQWLCRTGFGLHIGIGTLVDRKPSVQDPVG